MLDLAVFGGSPIFFVRLLYIAVRITALFFAIERVRHGVAQIQSVDR